MIWGFLEERSPFVRDAKSEVRHCPIEDFVENDVHLSSGERCATIKFFILCVD